MTAPFARPLFVRTRNKGDAKGTVRLQIVLIDEKRKAHRTGNITRSFTIHDVKVSEVAGWLEEKLFGRES